MLLSPAFVTPASEQSLLLFDLSLWLKLLKTQRKLSLTPEVDVEINCKAMQRIKHMYQSLPNCGKLFQVI